MDGAWKSKMRWSCPQSWPVQESRSGVFGMSHVPFARRPGCRAVLSRSILPFFLCGPLTFPPIQLPSRHRISFAISIPFWTTHRDALLAGRRASKHPRCGTHRVSALQAHRTQAGSTAPRVDGSRESADKSRGARQETDSHRGRPLRRLVRVGRKRLPPRRRSHGAHDAEHQLFDERKH